METQTHDVHVKEIVSALNSCIETCIDSEKGYALAAADVRDAALKTLFMQRSEERARFVSELQLAVSKLGLIPENQGTAGGMAHRGWVGIRKALEGKDEWMIAGECQREEERALKHYQKALMHVAGDDVPGELRALLQSQYGSIQSARDDLRHRYS